MSPISKPPWKVIALLAAVLAPALVTVLLVTGIDRSVARAAQAVAVYPTPGSHAVQPKSQISFRGIPAAQLGSVVVTGSSSGNHTGTIRQHSDSQGGSFLPTQPFTPGERVTVVTQLNVVGASHGVFSYTVAQPFGGFPQSVLPPASRLPGDIETFRSRRDLKPAAVVITRNRGAARGDIFLGPQAGPLQNGPMIREANGRLIWFKPLRNHDQTADFRVQRYQGRPVLTYWQGKLSGGTGVGQGIIDDQNYHQVAAVSAGNGLSVDLHEFRLTSSNTALVTAYAPVRWDATSAHGLRNGSVLDSVVQEIDIPTGLVLFEWHSLDNVPVSDSEVPAPRDGRSAYDYFHINSIDPDLDGDLVISARNTWAAYKIDRASGRLIWRLGGKHSSFRLSRGDSFAFQHDVRVRAAGDRVLTMFDNGGGPPVVHKQSRGLKLALDFTHLTARSVASLTHGPSLSAQFEGDFQSLGAGHSFLGWGQQGYFTEFDSRGRVVYDGHFVSPENSYRVVRASWTGIPTTKPAIALSRRKRTTTVYASWNGASVVSFWRVLAGGSQQKLRSVATVRDRAFETAIAIAPQRYVAVQALDGNRRVLTTSATRR